MRLYRRSLATDNIIHFIPKINIKNLSVRTVVYSGFYILHLFLFEICYKSLDTKSINFKLIYIILLHNCKKKKI